MLQAEVVMYERAEHHQTLPLQHASGKNQHALLTLRTPGGTSGEAVYPSMY